MSAYEPPTEIDPIFNSLAFRGTNDASLTIAEGDERYLARQNVATSVATATSFSAEVAATSWTSLNSGATNFHLDNLAGNNAPLIIRNQRTDQNTFYRQLGTTNSHIFQTDGTTTTNLTLSKTLNTSSLPFLASFAAGGNASRIIEVIDSTSGNRLALIPSSTNGNLGPMVLNGDTQIVAITGGVGNAILSIMPWTNTTVGIRMTGTQLNIGAGGTASVAPTSAILFNSSAGNATMTGNLVMSNTQINDCSAVTSINSVSGGITISNSANNTGGMVIQNANTGSNIRYNQFGTTASHVFSTNNTATTNLTLSNTVNTSSLPFTFSKQTISTPGAVITGAANITLALPLNDMYFITTTSNITASLPTNSAAYAGSRVTFRRTVASGSNFTINQTGGASVFLPAGSVIAAPSVSLISATTFSTEFISDGTFWCQLYVV